MRLPTDPIQFWTALGAVGAVLAAIGTIAAFIAAFYQIAQERSARHKEEDTSARNERMAQARRISAWIGGAPSIPIQSIDEEMPPTFATLLNASGEPVYRVAAWLVLIQGAGPHTGEEMQDVNPFAVRMLGTLPPGAFVVALPGDWHGMYAHPGVEIAFTDVNSLHWIRRATGAVEEVRDDVVNHYGLPQPVDWEEPVPAA